MNSNLLGRWISVLYRFRKGFINKQLEKYGIGDGQFFLLLALNRHDGASQGEISDHLKIDKATTAKALKKLEENGYVIRKRDMEDKRAYKVYLTQKSHDIMPVIYEIIEKWEKMMAEDISEQDLITVEDILCKMAKNACNMGKKSV